MRRLMLAVRGGPGLWVVFLGLALLPAAGAWAQQCEQIGGACATIQAGSFNTCDAGFIQTTDSCSPLQGQERVCCLPQACEARSANAACYTGVYTCPAGTTSLGDGGCTNGSCCAPVAGPTPTPTPNPNPAPPPMSGGNTYRLEFVHTDMLGSVRMVTDATGAVVSRHDYKPFGEEVDAGEGGRDQIDGYVPAGGDPRARERFTGKPRDLSGLDYFGARYYASGQGRFTSVDPKLTGVPYPKHLINPQRWNMFAYGLGNPTKWIDPDGEDVEIVINFTGSLTREETARIQEAVKTYLSGLNIGEVVVRSNGSPDARTWSQKLKDTLPFDSGIYTLTADADDANPTGRPQYVPLGKLSDVRKADPSAFAARAADAILHEGIFHQALGMKGDALEDWYRKRS